MANSGFDASSAATATRNILLNLADGSGKLALALGGPVDNLEDLVKGLKKLNSEGIDLNKALDLTDKRSVAAFNTFLNGTDTVLNLRDAVTTPHLLNMSIIPPTPSTISVKKVNEEYSSQEAKIKTLVAAINDENLSNYTRKQRLDELKELIPDYNAELNEEGRLINNNKEAIDQYLVSLEKQIKLKAYQEELEELYKKKRNLESQESEQSDAYWDTRQQNTLSGYNRNSLTA